MKKNDVKLNYSKIKGIAAMQGVEICHLAKLVNLTENGFKASIETGNFKAKNVMLICEKLNISPNDFFGYIGDSPIAISQSGSLNNQTNNLSSISALEKQLEVKDKQIEKLLNILSAM